MIGDGGVVRADFRSRREFRGRVIPPFFPCEDPPSIPMRFALIRINGERIIVPIKCLATIASRIGINTEVIHREPAVGIFDNVSRHRVLASRYASD